MTFARPVGIVPARPTDLPRHVSRGSAFAAAGILAALNAEAGQILSTLTFQSPVEAILGLAGISAVIWAAMIAAWTIGSEDRRRLRDGRDYAVLAAVTVLAFLPISYASQAGLLLCGSYLLVSSRGHGAARRASLVLLALTGPLIWGRILLNLFAAPILALDAHIVGNLIGTGVDGNIFQAANGKQFVIGDLCSSVHNMSLAIVLWMAAAMLFDIRIDRRYVAIGAAMAGFMFALNIARLATIGLFPAYFHFLHFGTGAALFGWAGLIGATLLAGWGVANAVARQR